MKARAAARETKDSWGWVTPGVRVSPVTSHQARAHVITILGARCQMATRMRYKEREARERERERGGENPWFVLSDFRS